MATLGVTRDYLAKNDAENLLLDDKFCRWLFTILTVAGISEGYFHPEVAVLASGEGRRGLGLDILNDLAAKSGQSKEEVLNRILSVEIKTQKEVQNARRSRNEHDRNRRAELDGDVRDLDD
jgi:hypothetical protein